MACNEARASSVTMNVPHRRRITARLWMIWLAPQIGVHQIRPFGMGWITVGGLEGDEHGINDTQNFPIVALEDPAALRLVIGIENTQATYLLVTGFLFGPHAILIIGLLDFRVTEVVSVEH